MEHENPPVPIWFAPSSWRWEELRRVAVWGVVIVMFLSSVAPGVLRQILQGIGYVCLTSWISLYQLLDSLIR